MMLRLILSKIFIVFALVLLDSCIIGDGALKRVVLEEGEYKYISGTITPLLPLLSQADHSFFIKNSFAAACSPNEVTVSLFLINSQGVKESSPLLTTTIDDSAQYQFDRRGIELSTNISHIIEASGCNYHYSRALTEIDDKQDIDAKTSMVSYLLTAETTKTISEINRTRFQAFINKLEGDTVEDVIDSVNNNANLISELETLFNTTSIMSVIEETAPVLSFPNKFEQMNEDESQNFEFNLYHFNASFAAALEWCVDGNCNVVASPAGISSFNFSTGKNDQGVQEILFKFGSASPGGIVNLDKPYSTETLEITVLDSFPATPPDFELVSGLHVTSSQQEDIKLRISSELSECETFSLLGYSVGASSLASDATFNITCSSADQIVSNIDLGAGEDTKTIKLWAKDSSDNISETPTIFNIYYDTSAPVISLDVPTKIKGDTPLDVSFSASDAASGINSVSFAFAENGVTFSSVGSTSGTSFSWTPPAVDTTGSKLRIVATDIAGNSATATSLFDICSTAPEITQISNDSTPAVSKTWNWGCNYVSCSYRYYINQTADASPTGSYGKTTTATQSTGDGNYYIHLQVKDEIGNESPVYHYSAILDNTAPEVTGLSNSTNPSPSVNWSWGCNEANCTYRYLINTTAISTPSNSFGSTVTADKSGTGTFYIHVQAKDPVGNVGDVQHYSAVLDSISPSISSFSADAKVKGGNPSTITFSATDANSSISSYDFSFATNGGTFNSIESITSGTSFTWTPPTIDDTGSSIRMVVTDIAGNSATATTVFDIDSTAPAITDIADDLNLAKSKTWTWDCNDINCSYLFSIDNVAFATPSGTWVDDTSTTQVGGDGTYYIHLQVKDDVGNESIVYNYSAELDNTGPSLTGLVDSAIPAQSVNWNWGCSEGAGCDYRYKVDLVADSIPSGVYGPTNEAGRTGSGIYYLHVQAKDDAGNEGSVEHFSATLDSTSPSVYLEVPPTVQGERSYDIEYEAIDGESGVDTVFYSFAVDGVTYGGSNSLAASATSFSWEAPLVDQTNSIMKLWATDIAANSATITVGPFKIDSTAPIPTGIINDSTVKTAKTWNWGCSENSCEYQYLISADAIATPSGGWVEDVTALQSSGDGNYYLHLQLKDDVDNESPVYHYSFILDNTAPSVINLSNSSTPEQSVNWNWDCSEASCRYRYLINATADSSPEGSYGSVTSATKSGTGTFYIHVQAEDDAGNEGEVQHFLAVLDSIEPLISDLTVPTKVKGGSSIDITFSVTDADSSIDSITFYFATNGGSFNSIGSASTSGSSFAWTPPTIDDTGSSIKMVVTDVAGNSASTINTFDIDSTAPIISGLADDSTPATSKTWSWSCNGESNCEYQYLIDTNAVATPAGSYGTTPLANVDSVTGTYYIHIQAKDEVGNVSPVYHYSAIIDNTAATIINLTNSGTPAQSVNWIWDCSEVNCKYRYLINETAVDSPDVNAAFGSATSATRSGTGTFYIHVQAEDAVGNVGEVFHNTAVLDSINPLVSLTDLTSIKGGAPLDITFIATDTNTGINSIAFSFATDGATFNPIGVATGGSSFSWTPPSLDITDAKIKMIATDLAGNSAETIDSFNIDSTAPIISGLSDDVTPATSKTWTWGCNGELNCEYQYLIDTNAITTPAASYTAATTVTQNSGTGNYYIHIRAKDEVGNVSPVYHYETVLDNTAPSVTLLSSSTTPATSYAWSWGCTEASCSYIYEINQVAEAIPSGSFVAQTEASQGFGDGTYYVHVQAKDIAGNIGIVSHASAVLDNTPPVLTSTTINDGTSYTGTNFVIAKVSAIDGQAVESIRLSNPSLDVCQDAYADDSWQTYSGGIRSYSHQISSGDGIKKVCVWAKDVAGNVSVSTESEGVDIDNIIYQIGNSPVIVSLNIENNNSGSGYYGSTIYTPGDEVLIEWTITDVEGLDNNPVTLWYSLNNSSWTEIVADYGGTSGGLIGNPTSYSDSYTSFTAPSSNAFYIKIVAKDMASNTSSEAVSNIQNGGNWSIYAGTKSEGVGGSALTLKLEGSSAYVRNTAAIDPNTNNAYVVSHNKGYYKLDAQTGRTEKFLGSGTPNLVAGETLDSNYHLINSNYSKIFFDNNGVMYISATTTVETVIFQIDPDTKMIKHYIGLKGVGGVSDETATPANINVNARIFVFDEDNSLYFTSRCSPGSSWSHTTEDHRLLKVTQNPVDKTADTIGVVAGNCEGPVVSASAAGGYDPLDLPLFNTSTNVDYRWFTMAVWDHGNKIIYCAQPGPCKKIINGLGYTSNLSASGYGNSLYYHPFKEKLYLSGGFIYEVSLDTNGDNNDTTTLVVANSGTGDCLVEGTLATDSCSRADAPLLGPNRTLAFLHNTSINGTYFYRLRYLDDESKIYTYVGSDLFYGEGLDKNLIRSDISGIYYKQAGGLNMDVFPEGLYFFDQSALIMGYIDPITEITEIIWGTKTGAGVPDEGEVISTANSLGPVYTGGNAMPLMFDSNGLPWLRANTSVYTVGTNKQPIKMNSTGTTSYYTAANGDPATNYGLGVDGGLKNFALYEDEGLFILGVTYGYTGKTAKLLYFDYENNSVTHIMGASGASAAASLDGGDLQNKTFHSECGYFNSSCHIVYFNNRLYFSENQKLRYIQDPVTDPTPELFTEVDLGRDVGDFILNHDGSKLFYISGGKLYCHLLSGSSSWCDGTSLGPLSGMVYISTYLAPNQLTWKDDNNLLISTYDGLIYQYALDATP